MDSTTGKPGLEARKRLLAAPRNSLREAFEALPLAAQFRLTAVAAVTVTMVIVLVLGAIWDTRIARDAALDLARTKTESMAARLGAAGGGALDNLEGHPEILAATFQLQGGNVLQRYVRDGAAEGASAATRSALAWTARPSGWLHAVKRYLALEPIYVDSPVQLHRQLTGSVSVLLDHRWIWGHVWHRVGQVPIAILLGCLVAWVAANLLRRQVAEPLAQLAETTRVPRLAQVEDSGSQDERRKVRSRRNELTELAANFDALARQLSEYEGMMSTVRNSASQHIVDRTREIEAKLRRAEALVRSKDDFLANMSHEIRTPMNGVLGMAELLAGTDLDKRQRRFVDSMRAAAETMMGIINDILDDSKIEAGKMDLVTEPFEVRELAEQAGQLYAGPAERKKLEMICRIEPTVPSVVVGDALRLRQVLGNLLSNAVKYTERGEVEIRVGLDDIRDGHCRLHFSIRDTGPGIPDPEHSGVFEPFHQLDNGTRQGGTGLGLSIATRLVKLMGGERIDLSSQVGQGSTFSFVLPFEVREAAPMPNRASDEFSGLRVLVVDDNPNGYMLLEEMMSNWSAEVTVLNRAKPLADRLQNAVARNRPFDVIILDHGLPDATTDELLRVIRLDPATAGTYVVLLSALDFDPSYEGTRVIAPDVCIAKPVRQALMRSALAASREPRQALAAPPVPDAGKPAADPTPRAVLGLHVLVVDDNIINREVAVAMLEEFGCTVVLADEGRAAVAHAEHERFDLILMDCQMPGMNGYDATEAIRADEVKRGLRRTPVVALTANVMARDRERAMKSGMDSFLAKPFKAAQLFEVLQPIAGARGTVTEPRPAGPQASPTPVPAPKPAPMPKPTATVASVQPAPAVTETITLIPHSALTEATAGQPLDAAGAQALLESAGGHLAPISRLPVLDLEQVQSIRSLGKPQLFERMCEMLFASSKEAFNRLDAAIADGNLEEVAAAAHGLKSPVSNLGGRRLADLLERCEVAALEGADIADVRRSAAGLKAHYAALVAALESETRRGTGTG
jgi:signal transduction histidine kinase/CheY-like chemotaxis protein/HPt (histidine-containing phosphotransfer) domain-containing protein